MLCITNDQGYANQRTRRYYLIPYKLAHIKSNKNNQYSGVDIWRK